MSEKIREFYTGNKLPKVLVNQKIKTFEKHPDIAAEFENWIAGKGYKDTGAVIVEGYSAKKLAEVSEYLNGDGAFIMLIELRENPEGAKRQIVQGFKRK